MIATALMVAKGLIAQLRDQLTRGYVSSLPHAAIGHAKLPTATKQAITSTKINVPMVNGKTFRPVLPETKPAPLPGPGLARPGPAPHPAPTPAPPISTLPLLPLPPAREIPAPLRKLRIVLFMTTSLSSSHAEFLRKCWAHAIRNSALLMQVETLIFYTPKEPTPGLLDAFTGKKVTVKLYNNPGWQEGAISAMEESTSKKCFAGYDWMIRLNPDVLILDNDEFLIKNLLDPEVDGIFADCWDHNCLSYCPKAHINTDFFAVRVSVLHADTFTKVKGIRHAETSATHAFKDIMSAGRARWLPGVKQKHICRIRGNLSVPVVHAHNTAKQCPLRRGGPLNRAFNSG